MASLKDIRKRIGSVKNTQKITRAMKLVAAAKFARANAAVIAARPYAAAFQEMLDRLVTASGGEVSSPLIESREEKRALVCFVATDRGFCGALNANCYKSLRRFCQDKEATGVHCDIAVWGKRARMAVKTGSLPIVLDREKILEKPRFTLAKELADEVVKKFTDGEYDRIYVCYTRFQSALVQVPTVTPLLPVGNPAAESADDKSVSSSAGTEATRPILTEPVIAKLLASLLEKGVASKLFQILLEGSASEHGARMTAMDSATNNAEDVIRKLTIEYNRARQAAITKELIEITSGAEAL